MVDSSGIDLAHEVREQFRIPVILCTGRADEQTRAETTNNRLASSPSACDDPLTT
jgi:DNA-binding response OmpR family regulator